MKRLFALTLIVTSAQAEETFPLILPWVKTDNSKTELQITTKQLLIVGYEGAIKIDLRTGEVVVKEGLSMNEASKLFWSAVQRGFPIPCPQEPIK